MVERACRLAFMDGFARAGQRVIVVARGAAWHPWRNKYAADCFLLKGLEAYKPRHAEMGGPAKSKRIYWIDTA